MEEIQFRHIRRLALGLALVAGIAASGATQAAFLAQTQTLNSNNNPTFTGFNGFNAPGTLTAVTLGWDLALDVDLIANGCRSAATCVPSIMNWYFSGSTGAFATVGDFDEAHDPYSFVDNTVPDGSPVAFVNMVLNGSQTLGNLAAFLGAGSIGQVLNEWFSDDSAHTYVDQLLTGDITLTYTYDTVPAPATLALFGLGLAGIGLGRRRQRT